MRRICVVTGTRAEYGLLSRLMRIIDESAETQLQIIATNMHLSAVYGNTYKEIERDGFIINKKIPILEDGYDSAKDTVISMSKALAGFAKAFDDLRPDLVVVLGDRFELLAAAEAALIERIPIAHIHGGEITEGAYDDAIRHSITKMSHLHFPSTDEYKKRIIQLGEQPDRVFSVGALGVENIKSLPLMSLEEIEKDISFKLDDNTVLATYHPVTLGEHTAERDIMEFISALEMRSDLRIVFTMPNSDPGSGVIADAITRFVADNNKRTVAFKSLGVMRYLSVMKYVGAVLGNSSSGLLETPSFGIPTLNIGDRQKGRIAADSVLNCGTDKESILLGIEKVMSQEFKQRAKETRNPYDKEGTARKIYDVISTYPLEQLQQKKFYDIR